MKKENAPHNIHIGSIIKAKAAERGITETQLAKIIHCHSSTIHYIYKKRSINTEQLWKIAIALKYDFFTEIYGYSLPETATDKPNSDTITILISTDQVVFERKNGVAKITEYRRTTEK
jgi:transcriptional regulator with XRE-family HTH domain